MQIEYLNNHPVVHEVRQILADVYIQFGCGPQDAYVVGGAVRNCLMGLPIKDLDFATNAAPDLVQKLFEANGYKTILTGKSFGTIRVRVQDMEVEVTTYRVKEQYSDGSRKPTVVFGKRIEEDLARRDFTINAMAYSPNTGLVDPYQGQEDLKQGLLRTPLDPNETFSDDPLRMLRAARFASTYGFALTPEALAAMTENAYRVMYLSAERLKAEMDKLLVGQHVSSGLEYLIHTRVMNYILPEILPMIGMQQNPTYHHKDVWMHTRLVVEHSPATPLMRWTALLHDIAKPQTYTVTETGIHFYHHEELGAKVAEEIAQRFRFSTEDRVLMKQLIRHHMRPNLYSSKWSDTAVRRFKRECAPFMEDLLALSKADVSSMNPVKIEKSLSLLAELKERLAAQPDVAECPITGHQIMEMGLSEGKLVGIVKAYLLKKIEHGVSPKDTDTLLALAQKKVEELQHGK